MLKQFWISFKNLLNNLVNQTRITRKKYSEYLLKFGGFNFKYHALVILAMRKTVQYNMAYTKNFRLIPLEQNFICFEILENKKNQGHWNQPEFSNYF